MKPTKKQLARALELAVNSSIYKGQCPFGTVVCGRFAYCGCDKCLTAIKAHFLAAAKEKKV
jgi:hypothetical protein